MEMTGLMADGFHLSTPEIPSPKIIVNVTGEAEIKRLYAELELLEEENEELKASLQKAELEIKQLQTELKRYRQQHNIR